MDSCIILTLRYSKMIPDDIISGFNNSFKKNGIKAEKGGLQVDLQGKA